MKRGMLWTRPIQRAISGCRPSDRPSKKSRLSRLAWAMHLTMNTSMDLRRVVPLVLRATGNDHYIRHTDQIVADIAAGQPIHVAFAGSRAFPLEFLDALEVAEESGQTVESMERLSSGRRRGRVGRPNAGHRVRLRVGLLVMGIIVMMIFRLAGFYLGTINSLLKLSCRLQLAARLADGVWHSRQLIADSPTRIRCWPLLGLPLPPACLDVLIGRPA